MKVYLKICLGFILLGTFLVDRCPAQLQKQAFSFNVLSEKKYEQGIRDVIYGEKKVNGDVKLYPQVIIYAKEAVFYDENNNLLDRKTFDDIYRAPKGNYIGLGNMSGYIRQFAVYNRQGSKIWERDFKVPFDDGFSLRVSDKDGSVAKVENSFARIQFFDATGIEIRSVELFNSGAGHDINRGVNGQFSKNGQYFVAVAEKDESGAFRKAVVDTQEAVEIVKVGKVTAESVQKPINKEVPRRPKKVYHDFSKAKSDQKEPQKEPLLASENLAVILFDSKGQELWRHYLDLLVRPRLCISDNGDFIIVIARGFIYKNMRTPRGFYLFNGQGKLIRKINRDYQSGEGVPINFKYSFSANNKFCVIANANWVMMMETATGEILWEKEFPWETRTAQSSSIQVISDIELVERLQEHYIIIESITQRKKGRRWHRSAPNFIVMNNKSHIVNQQEFMTGEDSFYKGQFQLSTNKREIIFNFAGKVTSFELN